MSRHADADKPPTDVAFGPRGELRQIDGAPEADLVFRLAGHPASGQRLDFAGITDWNRLLRLASDENALLALAAAAASAEMSRMPRVVERQLAILKLDRQARMRRLQERLENAIHALNCAGIEPLLLKGAGLAYTVYGSFSARPMRDIDLLVGSEEADRARAILLELGWVHDPELPGDRSYEEHHHLPPLRDLAGSGLRLEVHRALLPVGHPFRIPEQEIWSAARLVHVAGGRALVMHPAHHAVHIAIHFAWAHMLNLGAWHAFRDLAAFGTARALDWREFIETACRWKASTCCYWTLRLGRMLSGLPVSDGVLSELRPALPEFMRRLLARHFVRGLTRSDDGCPSMRLNRALWSMAMQPRRNGHGAVRPWLVSLDLLSALEQKSGESADPLPDSTFLQLRRSSRYLSEILV